MTDDHATGDARAKLRWRCRRGMKELDLLLTRWLERQYPGASATQRAQFEALLALPDPELAAWLVGGQPVDPPELAALVGAIRTECCVMSTAVRREP